MVRVLMIYLCSYFVFMIIEYLAWVDYTIHNTFCHLIFSFLVVLRSILFKDLNMSHQRNKTTQKNHKHA